MHESIHIGQFEEKVVVKEFMPHLKALRVILSTDLVLDSVVVFVPTSTDVLNLMAFNKGLIDQ